MQILVLLSQPLYSR